MKCRYCGTRATVGVCDRCDAKYQRSHEMLPVRVIPSDLIRHIKQAEDTAYQLARNASNNGDTKARDAYGTVARSLEQIKDAVIRYADYGEEPTA